MEKIDKHQLDVLNDSAKELSAAACISKRSTMELILHILDIYYSEEREREFAAAVSALESICKKVKAKSTVKNCKVKARHP